MFIINNKSLYFKKEVDDKFHLFSRIVKYWGESTATSDPKYFALNGFQALVYLSQYQLLKSINGLSVFVESAALYMWTGISFDVSNKMLEYAQSGNADQDPVSRATYRFSLKMHDFMTGKWEEDSDYQELYKLTMDLGQFWPLAIYLVYTAMVNVELGKIDAFQDGIQKLNELAESFDNSHAKAQMYRIIVPGYFRFRKMDLCQNFFEEAIDYTSKTGHSAMLLVIYSAISQFYTLQGELAKARKAFAEAEKLIDRNKIITIYYCPYLLAKTKLEFSELKEMPAGSLKYKSQLKSVLKSAEKLISKSKKMKGSLAESYLLKAEIYQFRQKHAQAFRYYQLAIATGVKYNGRLDLSRAYFETGKFLSDPKTKYKELNGKPAGYYLEKARSMFEEMDLKWDMEEYRKFVDKI
jgi:tetratricopeptide (TPR) repeat protein